MKKKDFPKISLIALMLSFSLPLSCQMMEDLASYPLTEETYALPPGGGDFYQMSDRYYRDSSYDPFTGYSVNTYNHDYDYNYNYAYTLHSRCKNSHGFNSDAYLHRRYDNSTNFSSGISSYQGTSTGPGPNGGYPGTPRGVYKTRYFPQEY
jgi:hypothetical protein